METLVIFTFRIYFIFIFRQFKNTQRNRITLVFNTRSSTIASFCVDAFPLETDLRIRLESVER